MEYKKKLIEVALPLKAINAASAREKSIRHGHPSTLHLWWARRPLAAARAVIWASLVDDPSSRPDEFPTKETQTRERKRLFGILKELVKWENTNNEDVLSMARAEIMKSMDGNPPALLDPFAGGGSIPLEAQRLGLKAYASDLNPVAVMINKAMVEIPPRFAGRPPVNPEARSRIGKDGAWHGAQGLAGDVRYYGEWMKRKAFERIGHLYPGVEDEHGKKRTVIAWIWARTVKCPNPACGCEMPLANSFVLSRKKGREAYIQPVIKGGKIRYVVKQGTDAPRPPRFGRGRFRCISCGLPVELNYIREESKVGRMGVHMLAIVAQGNRGRLYVSPNQEHIQAAAVAKPDAYPSGVLSGKAKVNVGVYGFGETADLFTNRQLTALTTFSGLVTEAQAQAKADAVAAGWPDDDHPLSQGGTGALAYGQAVGVYLSLVIGRMADRGSSICSWDASRDGLRNTFGRQAIPMVWDYAEGNPFCSSSGSFDNMLNWVCKCINRFPAGTPGVARQLDAQYGNKLRGVMISTDPPYYDNIGYADLSDFFYIWLRQSLRDTYPNLFRTMLTPKDEELVATPYRFDGSVKVAREFFEKGMLRACGQMFRYSRGDIPVTIYYAYKQKESDKDANESSTGWETMLSALIQAGFAITGTWPIRTELSNSLVSMGTNALASSIVLVCRKRPTNAPICTRRDFINTLRRELKPALTTLQTSNIAPVDLAQSAIGPGMAVYSRFSKVLEADGTPMSVRAALQIINQELDLYFTEQDGELDAASRFCLDLYTQYAFNETKFGEADVLARAKNTSVEELAARGVLQAEKGLVRLRTREEIPEKTDRGMIWLLTQQLTRALEKDGVAGAAKIVANILTSEPERAKSLAYRLFTIAEGKHWAAEAHAYNALVFAWPEVRSKAAELQAQKGSGEQIALSDLSDN